MNKVAIGLVLISAMAHALRNFFTKKSGNKQIFVWCYEVFAMLFFFPPFIFFLLTEGIKIAPVVYISIITGFIHSLYWIFSTNALEKGDLSHVYPIMRSSPALVLIFSVLVLDEQVSFMGVSGIILVVLGAYVINMKKLTMER